MVRFCTFIVALFAFPAVAYAEPHCTPTTAVATESYPGAEAIPTSNNLILPTGKAVETEAQRLVVSGRLLDAECKPIPEAVVELWQRDPMGKLVLAQKQDLASPSAVFAGAGRTVTDGEGRFTFITGFPGVPAEPIVNKKTSKKSIKSKKPEVEKLGYAPRLNLKVKAEGVGELTTALFFSNDRRNAGDKGYTKLSAPARSHVMLTTQEEPNGDLSAAIDLVLPGKARYRTY